LEVAVAGQEFESLLDIGFWIQGDEIGLVAVTAIVVGGVERAGFFRFEREIAKALTGVHFPWAQDALEEILCSAPKSRTTGSSGGEAAAW
jgi:hypothetical protein